MAVQFRDSEQSKREDLFSKGPDQREEMASSVSAKWCGRGVRLDVDGVKSSPAEHLSKAKTDEGMAPARLKRRQEGRE